MIDEKEAQEIIETAETMRSACGRVSDIMGWDEKESWMWMGTPCEELGNIAPAELILSKDSHKLTEFINGMKLAIKERK